MKKNLLFFSVLFVGGLALLPLTARAQIPAQPELFEARVIEIVKEETHTREDGSTYLQQNLKLRGLSGDWKDKEVVFEGISEFDVIGSKTYRAGDTVIAAHSVTSDGQDTFYITDYVRSPALYWLVIIFVAVAIAVGRWKGIRSLISLLVSFFIIVYGILPAILAGTNPLAVGIIGSFFILLFLIYTTEGFNIKAHLAIASIIISLAAVSILAMAFTALARLSGMSQEEVLFLVDAGRGTINFSGLLLAGILIGTLGAMDDVVISQIEAVAQLKLANPNMKQTELFFRAFTIGRTHMGAMINTLFLAYAGAALPLLLLFSLKQEPFLTVSQIINNEMIATEIVRTLVGSIGIVLSIPVATFLAVRLTAVKK
jgi:uncharacterized membrane protein